MLFIIIIIIITIVMIVTEAQLQDMLSSFVFHPSFHLEASPK